MEHAAAAALVGSRTDGHALSAWVLGRVGGPSGTGLKPHVVTYGATYYALPARVADSLEC